MTTVLIPPAVFYDYFIQYRQERLTQLIVSVPSSEIVGRDTPASEKESRIGRRGCKLRLGPKIEGKGNRSATANAQVGVKRTRRQADTSEQIPEGRIDQGVRRPACEMVSLAFCEQRGLAVGEDRQRLDALACLDMFDPGVAKKTVDYPTAPSARARAAGFQRAQS